MKEWIISINDHTYTGDRLHVDNALSLGREAMKGKNAIIGVEKENVVILLSEPHNNPKQLAKSVTEYKSKGFKVYTA